MLDMHPLSVLDCMSLRVFSILYGFDCFNEVGEQNVLGTDVKVSRVSVYVHAGVCLRQKGPHVNVRNCLCSRVVHKLLDVMSDIIMTKHSVTF